MHPHLQVRAAFTHAAVKAANAGMPHTVDSAYVNPLRAGLAAALSGPLGAGMYAGAEQNSTAGGAVHGIGAGVGGLLGGMAGVKLVGGPMLQRHIDTYGHGSTDYTNREWWNSLKSVGLGSLASGLLGAMLGSGLTSAGLAQASNLLRKARPVSEEEDEEK